MAVTAVPVGKPTVTLTPPGVEQATGYAALGRAEGNLAGETLQPLVRSGEVLQARDVEHQSDLAGSQYGAQTAPADVQLPTGSTIAEEAFRRSAVVAAQARVGLDARAHVLDLVDKFAADPKGYQAALDAGSKAYLAKLPPELQPEAARTYEQFGSRGLAQVHERWKSEQVDQLRATVMQSVDGKASDAANMARAGDYAGALAQIDALHKTYAEAGPLSAGGSGALSAVEIERHHEAAADNVNYQFVRGLIDHSGNKGVLLKGLESGHVGDPTADRALSALKPETRDRLIAATRQEMAQDRADARQAAVVRDQSVAINRQLFMEGRAADQLRERVDGVKIDEPITRSEFLSHYPGTAAVAGLKAWDSYQRQTVAANVQGEFKTAPADVLEAHVAASAPALGQPGYNEASRYHDALVDGASAVLAKREQYPVEATTKSSPAVAQAWAVASQDPSKLPAAVQASIAEQQRLGIKNITPLPQGAVSATVGTWHAGQTAAERLGAIAPLTIGLAQQRPDGTYDDSLGAKSLKQLEKAGLDKGTEYALEAARQNDGPRAHEIIGWLAADPAKLPNPGEAKAKEVKAAVAQLYTGTNAARAEMDHYNLTGQPGAGEAAQRGQELLLRGAMIYAGRGEEPTAAAEHALRVLHGDKPVTTNPELGIVPLPPGVPAEKAPEFENALSLTRENVDLSHLAPTRERVTQRLTAYLGRAPAPGEVEGTLAQATADYHALAGDVAAGSRWLDAPGGYQLITPKGQAVPGPRPEPTKDELMAAVEHVTGRPVLRNADGSYATMEQITVTEPGINGGKPTNIPSIWDGKRVDEGEAIRRASAAIAKGEKVGTFVDFRPYDTIEAAVAAAKAESAAIEPAAYAWWDRQHPATPRIWTATEIQHHAMTGGSARPDLVGNPFAGGQGP